MNKNNMVVENNCRIYYTQITSKERWPKKGIINHLTMNISINSYDPDDIILSFYFIGLKRICSKII